MLTEIDALTGQALMRLWGVEGWRDPGARYFLWNGCCVFALVRQDGFYDIHMAMNRAKRSECRKAGKEILRLFGMNKLRAVILTDRPHVCNYATRMGFGKRTNEILTTIEGRHSDFFIMWREPGEYDGRSD